jgi:hypothetical protein
MNMVEMKSSNMGNEHGGDEIQYWEMKMVEMKSSNMGNEDGGDEIQ